MKIPKKVTQMVEEHRKEKRFFSTIHKYHRKSRALSEEASIHTATMTAIKIALKEIQK